MKNEIVMSFWEKTKQSKNQSSYMQGKIEF